MQEKYIELGLVGKPHGLRGELCVNYYADNALSVGQRVFLQAGSGAPKAYTISAVRRHNGTELVTFEGVTDRNASERLRMHTMLIPREELPELDGDGVYLDDILGFSVLLNADGSRVGRLEDFQSPTEEQDIWVIMTDDGKEILFPAVDEFIGEIDLDAETVRITPPDGLIELYTKSA